VAALTAGQIVDRVRSVCANEAFGLTEAVSWQDFDLQPESNIDNVYRVPPMTSQRSSGGFGYYEDRDESLQIWLAMKTNGDHQGTARRLSDAVHSLTSAVMRDGTESSGDYAVTDEGRGHAVVVNPGADYLSLRLTLAINYDAQF
jgi:hypothetical protein